jgi:ABC-type nitrate/sulfonate/bicarbonate transport system substrate-binding protein
MVRRGIVPLAATVAALALAGAGCGGGSDGGGSSGGSSGGVQSSITLGINNPNYATQWAIFVAEDLGYFKQEGIQNVRVVTTDNFVQGLVGGSLDISQGDTDQWFNAAYKSNKDIVYLGTYRDHEWHILGAKKGIASAQQLVGQNITAGERGGRNEFVMRTELQSLGVDPDKVKFVPLGGGSDARLEALLNGQVAGASIFPRHIQPLTQGGGKVLYKKLTKVPQEGIAVMGDYLEENRATVVAYLTATLKARKYIADPSHKQQVLDIMRKHKFEIPPEFASQYMVEVRQISPDGGFVPAEMTQLVKEEADLGLMPKDLDWHKFTDLSPLYAAQKAVGLQQRPTPQEVQGS